MYNYHGAIPCENTEKIWMGIFLPFFLDKTKEYIYLRHMNHFVAQKIHFWMNGAFFEKKDIFNFFKFQNFKLLLWLQFSFKYFKIW